MTVSPQPTPTAKMLAFLETDEDGHARWTGPRNGTAPRLRHSDREWPIRRLAYVHRWGREPVGYVQPGCGARWCLAGDHLEDDTDRAAFRALGL